ncbi:hypothetical protein HZA33_04795, partial [Candidatus Pacearchaeota archaeon]|nr:hypothetical protein [Candidatus Pacearchaeota archaeon]
MKKAYNYILFILILLSVIVVLELSVNITGKVISRICSDSDGGKIYDIQGTVTYKNRVYTDYCTSSTLLREYYCNLVGRPSSTYYTCPYSCANGACVTALTTPAAPSNLAATATDYNKISLVWTDNSNNEDKFIIERSTDGISFTQIITVP